ncbi:MAG: hypothetical protein ACLGJD_06550 [Gammaproteobacteria bacterium]|jgi:3-oxoacyl-[acyl-carrier-protein] synthase III
MALNISLRKAGRGHSLHISALQFHLGAHKKEALLSEIEIGNLLIDKTISTSESLDFFFVASSLPRIHRALLGPTLARSKGLSTSSVLEFSGACGTTLDALYHIFCTTTSTDRSLMLTLDSFNSSYNASSSGESWLDGGAALLFCPTGKIKMTLLAYASAFDGDFLEMAHPVGGQLPIPLIPKKLEYFESADREAIYSVATVAASSCQMSLKEFDEVIAVNRSLGAIHRIERRLGVSLASQSRKKNSHVGGADLIANLKEALKNHSTGRLLILGFGLGYTWQAMIVEFDNEQRP